MEEKSNIKFLLSWASKKAVVMSLINHFLFNVVRASLPNLNPPSLHITGLG